MLYYENSIYLIKAVNLVIGDNNEIVQAKNQVTEIVYLKNICDKVKIRVTIRILLKE